MIMLEKKQTSYEGEVGSWLRKIQRFCLNKRLWDVYGVGFLLPDISVKIEIIDFLPIRTEQKDVKKYHNYTRLCSTFIAFSQE